MPRALPPVEAMDLVPLADIARGGMGSVQLCRVDSGRLAGRVLAVKRLNPELERDPQFVNMFIDETWMTAAIASPNVIRVEAWGQDSLGHYLAVELVQGVSLARLVKEARAKKELFSERTTAFVLSQICAGLEAAHTLKDDTGALMNLVHRDLTPGNILVGFDGVVKIADFGIAKANTRLTETTAGTMKGKPSYMAPEQAKGVGVDARADLFSLGVMAYELLAGQRPWVGANDLEVLIAVSSNEPVDLAQMRQVDPVFLEITRGCLQKDRDRRFGTAAEVRQRLDRWRHAQGYEQGDLESLSGFVRRNTEKQLEWFERALAGTQRDGATFKDVEEQIDKARKPSPSQDRRREMGRPAAAAMSGGSFPVAQGSPGSSSGAAARSQVTVPSSGHMRPPGQLLPASPPPRPEVDDLAATRYVPSKTQPVDDLAATRIADDLAATRHIDTAPSGRGPARNLGGTIAFSDDDMAARMPRPPGREASAPMSARALPDRGLGGLSPPPLRAQPTVPWPQPGNTGPQRPNATQNPGSGPQSSGYGPQSSGYGPQSSGTHQSFGHGPQSSGYAAHGSNYGPASAGHAPPQSAPQTTGYGPPSSGASPQSPRSATAPGSGPRSVHGYGQAEPRSSAQPLPKKGGKMLIGMLLILFVLVAAAVGAYFMRSRLGLG